MRRNRAARVMMLLPIGLAAIAVFGLVVMSLWNWLMPAVFGLKTIGFWQALGLLVLSRILFGSFGGGHRGRHSHRHIIERWEKMTPEEREKFREGLRARWGHYDRPEPNVGE